MAGKLIVGMGLPGSGKSSVALAVAARAGCFALAEPEEHLWPEAVHERHTVGCFTALNWFRSMRVPALYRAASLRDRGATVVVDSYYDKLLGLYLGRPGMEWLINPDDAYYSLVQAMAALDYRCLPDADCIFHLYVTYDDWQALLKRRARRLDKDPQVLRSYDTHRYFLDASSRYAQERGIPLLVIRQEVSSPDTTARTLHRELVRNGVLPELAHPDSVRADEPCSRVE